MTKFKQYWVSLSPAKKIKLADDSGIARTYISSIAHGSINPTLSTMETLMKADEKLKLNWFLEKK